MKDLGQEAMDEMNRLLLNQKQLKMKLEKNGNYGESATIKNQLADASKTIKRLKRQLAIATKALEDILNDGDDYWDKDKADKALTKMEGVK